VVGPHEAFWLALTLDFYPLLNVMHRVVLSLGLRSTLLDEFVLAHSLGWWAKALLIRNTALLWVYSVMFELLELTFAVRWQTGGDKNWDGAELVAHQCNQFDAGALCSASQRTPACIAWQLHPSIHCLGVPVSDLQSVCLRGLHNACSAWHHAHQLDRCTPAAFPCPCCLPLLQHMLPNFNECWWDSWVLDVLVCNSLGGCLTHNALEGGTIMHMA
jgi:hypothetical protein